MNSYSLAQKTNIFEHLQHGTLTYQKRWILLFVIVVIKSSISGQEGQGEQ